MPLGLSARDRLLPIWEPLYSSKAASWVGMLLERVILGAVAAVGLTGRTEGGDGRGQEKRQGGQRSGPWGWGTRSERVEWGGLCRLRVEDGGGGSCCLWSRVDSISCVLPALELWLWKVRLGAGHCSRNLHITRMCPRTQTFLLKTQAAGRMEIQTETQSRAMKRAS